MQVSGWGAGGTLVVTIFELCPELPSKVLSYFPENFSCSSACVIDIRYLPRSPRPHGICAHLHDFSIGIPS